MFNVEVLRTIDDVEKATLNELSNDPFFTYEWFKTLEASKTFKIIPRYFIVYENGKAVAIAPCFIEYESQYSTLEEQTPWIRRLRKIGNWLGFSLAPPLICHPPSSHHSRVLIQKGYNRNMILDPLCSEIDESCKKDRVLFSSFPFVSEFDDFLMTGLANRGYTKIPSVDTAYLDIKWSSFEGYLAHLPYGRRKTIRREIRQNRKHGITIEQQKDFHQLLGIISDLHSNLFMKYQGRRSLLNPSFFKALSEHAQGKTRLFVARKNSNIIGFSLCLEHRNVLDAYIAGFDYGRLTKTDFTYFNTFFYMPIRTAIEEGFEKIHFRSGSLEAKLLRGCRVEKCYLFIKCHVSSLNYVLSLYARMKHRESSQFPSS